MFLFNVAKKNEDGSVKSFEMLKLLNRIIFRGASCKKIVCCVVGCWVSTPPPTKTIPLSPDLLVYRNYRHGISISGG